jgi:spore cortex formation protein SpoVR/YcgB (stage V sporulation)
MGKSKDLFLETEQLKVKPSEVRTDKERVIKVFNLWKIQIIIKTIKTAKTIK